MERLYVVTRADLSPGAQIAQSCHALRAFVEKHPELDQAWHRAGGNLVCLSVPDERELYNLLYDADSLDLALAGFCEEDLGNQLTALALEGRAKRLLRALPLALAA